MHIDDIQVDLAFAKELVDAYCPDWRLLPISKVETTGTDHHMFRLGADKALRLPRRPSAILQVQKEQAFLPRVAKSLTIAAPAPIKSLAPCSSFPYPWSVCQWLEGETLSGSTDVDTAEFVRDIALTLLEIWQTEVPELQSPDAHNFFRGVPLEARDEATRRALHEIGDEFDTAGLLKAWQMALKAPQHDGSPKLIHGDLSPSNLLVRDGHLVGVLDWGGMALGDPACDLMIAWNYLDEPFRSQFRLATGASDAMWLRGMGWALSVAAIQLPYYRDRSPIIAGAARSTINKILGSILDS